MRRCSRSWEKQVFMYQEVVRSLDKLAILEQRSGALRALTCGFPLPRSAPLEISPTSF